MCQTLFKTSDTWPFLYNSTDCFRNSFKTARLSDKLGNTSPECELPVGIVEFTGDHQDTDTWIGIEDRFDKIEATAVREFIIEEDDAGTLMVKQLTGFFQRKSTEDFEFLVVKHQRKHQAKVFIIINDKYTGFRLLHRRSMVDKGYSNLMPANRATSF
jgi:hypothetical protein